MFLQINALKPMQSPAMLRGKRSFISYVPPPISERELASIGSQKQHVFGKTLPSPSSNMEEPVYQHLGDLKDVSSNESDSILHSQPPVEDSDNRLSNDEFHLEKNLLPASTASERDSQSDLEESNQIVQHIESDTKTEICYPHDDKNSRISTNGLQSAKSCTLNNVITKPKRATAGNFFQNA